jgi:hypothetical protein
MEKQKYLKYVSHKILARWNISWLPDVIVHMRYLTTGALCWKVNALLIRALRAFAVSPSTENFCDEGALWTSHFPEHVQGNS